MADYMFPGSPRQMQAYIVRLETAAKNVSLAADRLKEIEGGGLDEPELSDAWEHAYDWLYDANKALKALLLGEDSNEQ